MEGRRHTQIHRRQAPSGGAPARARGFGLLLALAAVAAAAAAGIACVSGLAGGPAPDGAPPETPAFPQEPSGKLAGATESVDENGVVHGTTPAGVNYLLWGRGQAGARPDRVTLVAAGDQIGTDQVLELTDAAGGAPGDGVVRLHAVLPGGRPVRAGARPALRQPGDRHGRHGRVRLCRLP